MNYKKAKHNIEVPLQGKYPLADKKWLYIKIYGTKSCRGLKNGHQYGRTWDQIKKLSKNAATPLSLWISAKFNNFVTISHRDLKFWIWRGFWKSILDLCIKVQASLSKFERVWVSFLQLQTSKSKRLEILNLERSFKFIIRLMDMRQVWTSLSK